MMWSVPWSNWMTLISGTSYNIVMIQTDCIIVMIVCQEVLEANKKWRKDMQAIGRMKSIETMERITRQKFCDNFDEILDRVDKEDIGFVILNNEGKDGHVLCPARWFQINFSDDLGCIINSALRYAIHRHTYMPGVVVAFIRKYINILDRRTIEVAIRDIEEELKLGGVDDSTLWIELKDELVARLATMQPPEEK